jgi:predicted Zn-dependent peptidase
LRQVSLNSSNNDITHFYDILPAKKIETAFWLESDRMFSLNFDPQTLEVQRKVVLEEFKETCLNQPYGDVWHHLTDMAYQVHPYRWPTIGKIPKHVEEATLEDVKAFYQRYYRPNNAVLTVSGRVTAQQVFGLAEKWFGDIPAAEVPLRKLPKEPRQNRFQQRVNEAAVPTNALYLAFHMPARTEPDFYAVDLLSDILAAGPSSRLYRRLLKDQRLFATIDAYVSGSMDPGLLIVEGRPVEGVSLETAEQAIWKELNTLKENPIPEAELQKVKNKTESNLAFSELNVLNKAINLAYFEVLGEAELVNREAELYQKVTTADIQRVSREILTEENCSELHYIPKA